ncbi:MAG: UDP-N-acetylglucosamine 1-carboxyvinyltransferase [Clostridium sp.]|uniref:UDP-N-acetylglucosamine 1-carboxyvinyltransferase n=1 Tax=Clostridium sp. TaxID=1506 RepID=UPI0030254DAD
MCKFYIKGNDRLIGDVNISSAKNAVLPILASTILADSESIISNVPMLDDVYVLCDVLKSISAEVNIDKNTNRVRIDAKNLDDKGIDNNLIGKMRAAFLVIGPLVARFGKARISLPGGCKIGARPIDLYLKGLKALGATIKEENGYVEVSTKRFIGGAVFLDYPSVGATENLMMSATLAEGKTYIENAAREPEIVDLANFLNKMGARIIGAGTSTICIIGVDRLTGANHSPIFDRIEAGTMMVAAPMTRGKITINGVDENYLRPAIFKLREMGVKIDVIGDKVIVDGDVDLKPINIITLPHPGFPTDMQSQMLSLLCIAQGQSSVKETVFENRFMQVSELRRMGANISINGKVATIDGVEKLTGAEVVAPDLRAGAGLILAALGAKGSTIIDEIYHIDRGYVAIEEKLTALGADIIRL